MPVLSNQRHERFAQELAKGKTQEEAYAAAGYRPIRACASRLLTNANVKARVAEIQARVVERFELSRIDILKMMVEDRQLARDLGQASAAIKAGELLGRELHAMFTERKEVRTGRLDGIDDAQLDSLIGAVESLIAPGIPGEVEGREDQAGSRKSH